MEIGALVSQSFLHTDFNDLVLRFEMLNCSPQAPEGASDGGDLQVRFQPDGKKSDDQADANWRR